MKMCQSEIDGSSNNNNNTNTTTKHDEKALKSFRVLLRTLVDLSLSFVSSKSLRDKLIFILDYLIDGVTDRKIRAASAMCSSLCCHFFGYECARAASIALLASNEGLGTQALSLTVVVGSPLSALTLYLYARSIKKNGALFTQRVSNILCIIGLSLILLVSQRLDTRLGQTAVILFYTFREIYVSLLSTQQWSFIASVLDKSTSSYIVTFAGIVSTASALGGCFVEVLVAYGGVTSLLAMSLFSCVFSYVWVETAYFLKEGNDHNNNSNSSSNNINNNNNSNSISNNSSNTTLNNASNTTSNITSNNTDTDNTSNTKTDDIKEVKAKTPKEYFSSSGVTRDFINLMFKYRTLQLLFVEAIVHQCSANMLNLMFHDGLRMGITEASYRAIIVGRFFATVNLTACLLQCFVLPRILSPTSLPYVLIMVPMTLLLISLFSCFNPTLLATMFAFGTLKVMEYSIMTASTELIYMPMGQEVRYLGKEMIRFFGHRLGKSAASLVLSYMVGHFKPTLGVQLIWSTILTVCWAVAMSFLATHLVDRERQTAESSSGLVQQSTPSRRTSRTGTDGSPIRRSSRSEIDGSPIRRLSRNNGQSTETTPTRNTVIDSEDNDNTGKQKVRKESGTWRTCLNDSPKAIKKEGTWRTSSTESPSFEPNTLGLRNRKHNNIDNIKENEHDKNEDIWHSSEYVDEEDSSENNSDDTSEESLEETLLTESIESVDVNGIEAEIENLDRDFAKQVQVLGPSTISIIASNDDWLNVSDDDITDISSSPYNPLFASQRALNKDRNDNNNNNNSLGSMVVRVGSTFFKFQNS